MSKVIKLGTYKGIEVSVAKMKIVSETEVEQEIQTILKQNQPLVAKEGPVAIGDVTTIDFEGFKDGVAFEGGKAQGHRLEIGSGQFIPGFEQQMIGMEKGETRKLNLTFPENYGVADLAGADVVFEVTVCNIEEKKEAQLNDEFVASINNPEIKTVADFKEAVKVSLQDQYHRQFQADKENAIFSKLMAESEIEVDEADIERAMQQQIQHIQMELMQQGLQLEQYLQMMNMTMDAFKQQLHPAAKQQAELEAIIDEIIVVENLETSNQEANQQVEMIAKANHISNEEVLARASLEDLKRDLTRIKASQLIISQAKVSEQ